MLDFLIGVINLVVVAFGAIGFFDAMRQNPQAFDIYGRGSKNAWLIGLAASAFVVFWFSMYSLFGIIGTVAIVVYQVDIKPNLNEINRPRY